MTYTTLRYLICIGLLFNALADVNASEKPNAPLPQPEDRLQSVSPPPWLNSNVGLYNQPNPAPQFISEGQQAQNNDCKIALKKHGLGWNEEPDRTSSPPFWTSDGKPYVEPEWKSSEHMQEIRFVEGKILSALDDSKTDIGSKIDMESSMPLMSCIHDVFWNTYVQSISNGKSRSEAIASFIERRSDNVAVAITNDSKFLDEVDKQIAEKKATPSS